MNLDGMQVYHVGEGPKCILWCYDIFGFVPGTCGRTRELADHVADNGYLVVMPDFYRGGHCDPSKAEQSALVEFIQKNTQLDKVDADLDKAVEFAKSKGANSFGAIGTCWGSVAVMRASRDIGEFNTRVGVSCCDF